MIINGKIKKDILTVKSEGRIDLDSSMELEKYLEENLDGITSVVFDFRKVEYISSAGLRVLLSLCKRLGGKKECVIVEHANDMVKSVFELTGFDEMLVLK